MRRDLAAIQSRLSTASYILRMVQARLASSRKLERLSLYGFGKLPLVLVPPKTPYLWLNARVAEENTEVVGFTSMSPSTKAKAYQWAAAIAGEIDPKLGWGPEDLIGGECVVVLEAPEDAQGTEKNKVVKVKPPRTNKPDVSKSEADGSEGELVRIPL
jgi:hypothetical protein